MLSFLSILMHKLVFTIIVSKVRLFWKETDVFDKFNSLRK